MQAQQSQSQAQASFYQASYAAARNANQQALREASSRGLDSGVVGLFNQITSITEAVIARGQSMFASLAMQQGRDPGDGSPNTYTPQPMDPYIQQVLTSADEMRARLTEAGQLGDQLIATALATVAPDFPPNMDGNSLAYLREDIVSLLENAAQGDRQNVASGLLSDAVSNKTPAVVALLLGTGPESLELVARRLPGLNITALRRAYIDQKVAANPSGLAGRGVMYSGGIPPVAAFIQLQDNQDRNMAAVVGYAGDFYDSMRAEFMSRVSVAR